MTITLDGTLGITNTGTLQVGGVATNLYPLVSGTAQTAPQVSPLLFPNAIPSWAKRVTIMFSGVSTNGLNDIQIQLGTGATPTIVNSGYLGTCSNVSTATQAVYAAAFRVAVATTAAQNYHGIVTLVNVSGNTWAQQGMLYRSEAVGGSTSAGSVTLPAALTAIQVISATDTFDAGTINIMWE